MGLWERLFGPKVPIITPAELAEAMRENRIVVVDIRDARDYHEAHIPGAQHVTPAQIPSALADLPADRPVVVVCRSGHRSVGAARKLLRAGRSHVFSLHGGMRAWTRAGLPVARGEAETD